MRDYKEIANSVFQRREAYLEEKKRKKAVIFRSAAVTLSCCLMIILGFGIWNMDFLKSIKPSQNKEPDNITPVTTTSVTTAVDYPLAMDLSRYFTPEKRKSCKYELTAVICHSRQIPNSHFYVLCKDNVEYVEKFEYE